STCFIRDVRSHITKLDPKALKCVFLGYSRLQKGYRCYSPDLNKYVVSTDVVFLETKQFFSSVPTPISKGEDEDWLIYQIASNIGEPPINPPIPEDGDQPADNTPSILDKPSIVQVYSRRQVTNDTCPAPETSSSSNPPPNDLDLPIS